MEKEIEQLKLNWEVQKHHYDFLWERYKYYSDQSISYLKIVINFTTFFVGISGAIISFLAANLKHIEDKAALWIPIIVGLATGGIYLYFSYAAQSGNIDTKGIAERIFPCTPHEKMNKGENDDNNYYTYNDYRVVIMTLLILGDYSYRYCYWMFNIFFYKVNNIFCIVNV